MADSYVTSKAILKCTFGDKTAKLTVYPDRTVELTAKPIANVSDHIPTYNIPPFGKCHTTCFPPTGSATAANMGCLTPMPCVPGTDSEWVNGKTDYIIKGKPALLKSSYCRCKWGGIIKIINDGQINNAFADLSKESIETEEQMKEKQQLNVDDVLDGIQMVLDVGGMVPLLGAAPDLLNAGISALRGDWLGAGISLVAAVPGIGDAIGGAKIAKNGVKLGRKAKIAKAATKQATEQPFGVYTHLHKAKTPDYSVIPSKNIFTDVGTTPKTNVPEVKPQKASAITQKDIDKQMDSANKDYESTKRAMEADRKSRDTSTKQWNG